MRYGIDRRRQDDYAARSHRFALAAQRLGRFDDEIVEIDGVRLDDGPRVGMPAMLNRFSPLFAGADGGADGTVTAGNSCRISDGAAAVAIVPDGSRGTAPGLALVAMATVGCDPALPGIGPVAAITRALADAGVTLADVAALEIVEAFSAQTLAVLQLLGLAGDDRACCFSCGHWFIPLVRANPHPFPLTQPVAQTPAVPMHRSAGRRVHGREIVEMI